MQHIDTSYMYNFLGDRSIRYMKKADFHAQLCTSNLYMNTCLI